MLPPSLPRRGRAPWRPDDAPARLETRRRSGQLRPVDPAQCATSPRGHRAGRRARLSALGGWRPRSHQHGRSRRGGTSPSRRASSSSASADTTVAIQGPNCVDTLVALLGCQRAVLSRRCMPAGWRNAEAAAAIERIGAKAILAATRAGPQRPADSLRHVAADDFAIRFVCGYGGEAPDGVMSFDDCITDPQPSGSRRTPRLGPGEMFIGAAGGIALSHLPGLPSSVAIPVGIGAMLRCNPPPSALGDTHRIGAVRERRALAPPRSSSSA